MLLIVKSYLVRAFSFKLAVSLFLCPCLCVVCVTCVMEQLLPLFRPIRRTQYQNWISLFSSPVLTVNLESGIGCVPCQPTKCYVPCVALTMFTGMQRKLWCKHMITKSPATKKARYKALFYLASTSPCGRNACADVSFGFQDFLARFCFACQRGCWVALAD